MVELIENEIMERQLTTTWGDIAGLEFAKKTINEVIIWPMLRPDIFKGIRAPPRVNFKQDNFLGYSIFRTTRHWKDLAWKSNSCLVKIYFYVYLCKYLDIKMGWRRRKDGENYVCNSRNSLTNSCFY